ncbi:MAG TPA: prolyl oligopeptidase family serine peptidase [Candidatus Xenobia bacterium]|jgi:prolyl oligopeptidase
MAWKYPPTRREDVAETLHGVQVPDPYRWLEKVDDPEVQTWMDGQDAFARQHLQDLPYRTELVERFKQLFYLDTIGAPIHRGNRYFYSRRHADKEKVIVYWKEGREGGERILFDPNTWSDDGSVSLGGWNVTHDGVRVAYSVRENNSDEATMHVKEVATDQKSDIDTIAGAKYAHASWTPTGDGFYYTWLPVDPSIPTADRPGYAEIRYHALGTDPRQDRLVRERTQDPTTFIDAELSRDGHWLILSVSHGWNATDVYYRDMRSGDETFHPLVVGRDARYSVWVWKDVFYILTNQDAPNERLMRAEPGRLAVDQWRDIVPENPDAKLEGFAIVGGRLALTWLHHASSKLEIRELDGTKVRDVDMPGLGSVSGLLGNEDEDEAYFGFDSFTVPREIHQTSVATGKTTLWFKLKIPVDPSPYVAEQVFFPSKDGTRLSMFIVRRQDQKLDGTAPMLLNGYGGFLVSMLPHFDPSLYPWLERGGACAVVNLRGGGEYGEAWHQDGMLLKKQNVFDDFVASAEYLISKGYTSASKLVIEGGSNGGLLMGAALTQRPDLFRVVLCAVPLLDMVRYHLFGSGKTWISEYGSADDGEQFQALHGYSPYHHVRDGAQYPAVLMLSADSDDRVDPMHARKFAAALQHASQGGPVLLRIEKHAGHGGADLIKASVEKLADEYAFALWQLSGK